MCWTLCAFFFLPFFRFVINKRAIKLNAHGDIEAIIDENEMRLHWAHTMFGLKFRENEWLHSLCLPHIISSYCISYDNGELEKKRIWVKFSSLRDTKVTTHSPIIAKTWYKFGRFFHSRFTGLNKTKAFERMCRLCYAPLNFATYWFFIFAKIMTIL